MTPPRPAPAQQQLPRLDLDTALRQLRAMGATDDELLQRDLARLRKRGATDAQLLALAAGLAPPQRPPAPRKSRQAR